MRGWRIAGPKQGSHRSTEWGRRRDGYDERESVWGEDLRSIVRR
jgi:hypothetical protein